MLVIVQDYFSEVRLLSWAEETGLAYFHQGFSPQSTAPVAAAILGSENIPLLFPGKSKASPLRFLRVAA